MSCLVRKLICLVGSSPSTRITCFCQGLQKMKVIPRASLASRVKDYLNPMCSHSLSHFLYTASVPVCPLMDLLARSIYTAALLTYSIPSGHFRKGSSCYRLCWPALLCCIYWFCLSVPLSSSERLSSSTHLMSPSKVDLVNIQTYIYWEHACMHTWLTLGILKIRLILMLYTWLFIRSEK